MDLFFLTVLAQGQRAPSNAGFLAESQGDARQEIKQALSADTLGITHCFTNFIARLINSQKQSPNPLLKVPPGPAFNTS